MASLNGSVTDATQGIRILPTCDSCGQTEAEATPRDGMTMFPVGKWWTGKLYGIPVRNIILGSSFLALCLLWSGFLVGMHTERAKTEILHFGGQSWVLVGMAKDADHDVFIPVYWEKAKAMKTLRPN